MHKSKLLVWIFVFLFLSISVVYGLIAVDLGDAPTDLSPYATFSYLFSYYFNSSTTNSTGLIGLTCDNGEILEFNSGTGLWECGTDSSGLSAIYSGDQYTSISGGDTVNVNVTKFDENYMWINGTNSNASFIQFNTDYSETGNEPIGVLFWNSVKGTLSVRTSNESVLDISQEDRYYVKANGDISNGDVVQFAGWQGDHYTAKIANITEIDVFPELIMGIATEDIANGEFGSVVARGEITMSTTGFTIDDLLYWDNTTGQLTNVEPPAPNRRILMAVIAKEETSPAAANGIVLVRITLGQRLAELEDVDGADPTTNGDLLTYDGISTWKRGVYNINNYALLNGSNQPFTGNITIAKNEPLFKLNETTTGYDAQLKKLATDEQLILKHKVLKNNTLDDQVPVMISDTSPSGVASADSYFSASTMPYKVFDDTTSTWITATGASTFPHYIQYQFSAPATIEGYSIKAHSTPYHQRAPRNWTFEASTNAVDWVVLDTQTDILFTSTEEKTFNSFTNEDAYSYYRLNITANAGTYDYYVQIAEIQMFAGLTETAYATIFNSKHSDTLGILSDNYYSDQSSNTFIDGSDISFRIGGVEKMNFNPLGNMHFQGPTTGQLLFGSADFDRTWLGFTYINSVTELTDITASNYRILFDGSNNYLNTPSGYTYFRVGNANKFAINSVGSHRADNIYSYYGTGDDARIWYDGTNFNIKSDVVGTGKIVLQSEMTSTKNISTSLNMSANNVQAINSFVLNGAVGYTGVISVVCKYDDIGLQNLFTNITYQGGIVTNVSQDAGC